MVKLTVEGEQLYFLVDSGAEVCVAKQTRVKEFTPKEVHGICCLDGTPLPIMGTTVLRLCKGSTCVAQLFYVTSDELIIAADGILGLPFLTGKGCTIDMVRHQLKVGHSFTAGLVATRPGKDRCQLGDTQWEVSSLQEWPNVRTVRTILGPQPPSEEPGLQYETGNKAKLCAAPHRNESQEGSEAVRNSPRPSTQAPNPAPLYSAWPSEAIEIPPLGTVSWDNRSLSVAATLSSASHAHVRLPLIPVAPLQRHGMSPRPRGIAATTTASNDCHLSKRTMSFRTNDPRSANCIMAGALAWDSRGLTGEARVSIDAPRQVAATLYNASHAQVTLHRGTPVASLQQQGASPPPRGVAAIAASEGTEMREETEHGIPPVSSPPDPSNPDLVRAVPLDRLPPARAAAAQTPPRECRKLFSTATLSGSPRFEAEVLLGEEKITEAYPARIEAISRVTQLSSAKHVRIFLGAVGHYYRLLPNLRVTADCLTNLCRKGAPFVWTDTHEEAVRSIQNVLCASRAWDGA